MVSIAHTLWLCPKYKTKKNTDKTSFDDAATDKRDVDNDYNDQLLVETYSKPKIFFI